MRKTILLVLVLISQFVAVNAIEVVSKMQIPIQSGCAYLPQISPTGDYIIYTGNDMMGLNKFDFQTKSESVITTDKGAGFNAQISSDGSVIVFRNTDYQGKLRYTTLKSVNMKNGNQNVIVKATRDLHGVVAKEGTVFTVKGTKSSSKKISGSKVNEPVIPSIIDGQLYITIGGISKQISPLGDKESYLWPSVSPDGDKLLFYVMSTGKSYISNIDGSNVVPLCVLRAPAWLGNNWVVGMYDTDNGEVVISSEIVAIDVKGNNRTALTEKDVISMYPSASADASKVVYNTADGKVFLMNINIK